MTAGEGPVIVTGAAGFIGYHLAAKLLGAGASVVGIDNLNPYYDVRLKKDRLALLGKSPGFKFIKGDLAVPKTMEAALRGTSPRAVAHLAAQAGVRYSLENPKAYVDSNVVAMLNVLEACRAARIPHLVFASSSSVYGGNTKTPFSEHENVDHPISLYAATKKSGELMAHAYAHLFGFPVTCLRFFNVYGPWGRPDMAYSLFTRAILEGKPIEIFNEGKMSRDFTYVDDIVECVARLIARPAAGDPSFRPESPDPATSWAPWRVYNIGNHTPVGLLAFVETLERILGKEAKKVMKPLQPGDVLATHADVADLSRDAGFAPSTPLETGLRKFVEWFREYYRL